LSFRASQVYNIPVVNQQGTTLAVLCLLTTTSMLYMFRTQRASETRRAYL